MQKVSGIKSVDFKIESLGHGVVNWNGPTTLTGEEGKTVDNHTLPKLRGYTNLTGRIKEENGYKYKKEATDLDFKKTPLYISQNCVRHHLFRDHAFDMHFVKESNLQKLLTSITGLIRGYVVPSKNSVKRTSPLLLEDFVDQLGNGNFEQFCHSGERNSSSFFSKTTFGDTKYISYGSINIENLQFISLDNKFDSAAMIIKEGQGEEIAQELQNFISSLNPQLNPKAVFHNNYIRKGTIFEEGQVGILLDNIAVQSLVEYTLNLISELTIQQARSYMFVDNMLIDYNNSNKIMRIKYNESLISETPESNYAVYYYSK